MMRNRPQLTIGELIDFMSKYPRNTLVYSAPSIINVDEPEETQEFIEMEHTPVVAVEHSVGELTIGYIGDYLKDRLELTLMDTLEEELLQLDYQDLLELEDMLIKELLKHLRDKKEDEEDPK